jgi:ABC-2 type transport system permease protein
MREATDISSEVETGAVTFDRPADVVTTDGDLGYRIYALQKPLQSGDSLRLNFEVRHEPRGFRDSGPDAAVVANGTYVPLLEAALRIAARPRRTIGNIRPSRG